MAKSRRGARPAKSAAGARTAPAPSTPGGGSIALFVAALLLLGVWAYSTSFAGVFIGDDQDGIVQNTTIRSLSPISQPLAPPRNTTLAARPIANFTFALNYAYAAGTDSTWSYHAVNLVIHLAAGLALFGIVRRSLLTPPLRDRFADAAAPLAFAVAAIWLAHPLHTQSVTFIVQRVESLMGLFYLGTLYCAIRAAETDFQDRAWTASAIVLCALGMGTKETMVTAPIIVTLWIWLLRPDMRLMGPPRGLLIGLAATMVIVMALAATEARSESAGFGVKGWTSLSYLRTQAGVIVHYVRLAFWPHPLVFQYGWLPAASWGAVIPQFAALAMLAAATGAAIVKRWPIAFLGAWFLLILAPSSSIVPIATEVAAEHRMYLPLAAIVMGVVLVLWKAASVRGLRPVVFASIVVALIAIPLAVATYARNQVYQSAERMALDVVENRPQNAQGRLTYGISLFGQRRYEEAETHLRAALSLPLPPSTSEATSRSLAQLYLGLTLLSQQRTAEAADALAAAIAHRSDLDRAYAPLAEAQLTLGRARDAAATLERAIARRPDDPGLLKRAAWVLATSSADTARNGPRAIELAQRAVAATGSRDPIALDTLAAAFAETGQFDQATDAVTRAIALVPPGSSPGLENVLRAHAGLFQLKQKVRTKDW